ncbi:ThuA domain-containing protein [Spirosoma endbachense]|uniref:C-type cytochrome n=1 Tax=Spirosoma endbachense TaxID=2666025 RepID=A0A6P1W8R2_9BACT|nr:ThuA domain-containing protein [Spirosoma endbachense]QHW00428.1 c-type cytochrome [Spirosoma endbachense]
MQAKRLSVNFLMAMLWLLLQVTFAQTPKTNVLVFSKTVEFRHESIETGKKALAKMASEKSFGVVFTEDAGQFNESSLKKYNTVVFLNTTGDVLNSDQQVAFERYIQAGGGYVGVHAATDTEYGWPWYGKLAGAYFLDHPTPDNVQKGKFIVAMKNQWSTKGMPDSFERAEEIYNFKDISPKINVVLTVDETSYRGGKNSNFHPISWYQEYDGGRSFYTAMGHTNEAFTDPLFLGHLWAGIRYTTGGDAPQPPDYSKARPEENRFSKVILAEKLDEPMELSVLNDGRVLFIQRKGDVKLYNTKTNQLKTIATIPVSLNYVSKEGKESTAEDGLLGLNKDPNFAQNHWIYLYYSPAGSEPKNVLARFELKGDELVLASKKILLEIATQREECCHTGGSIAWDKAGNLYLSTGDNTNPHASNGYSPSDEGVGRSAWDAQKSSANTADLRGKIIRIKPQPDGTYTIPDGNLFPKGTPQTRPEIYTMGHRNPFRISIDQKTGYVYWGEVGPDASKPDSTRGPAGQDEVGQARTAGNFGWPHFVGDNKAYTKFDFGAGKAGAKWDANKPTNTSPNNTGLTELPLAQKAFTWYPYSTSTEFPLVGSGGRNAMAGPVYYADEVKNTPHAFPAYYNGKLLIYDWMRGWIMAVTMDKLGNYQSMERFMPSYTFSNPMDMEFAADGDLYMLEYGSGWFTQNDDARLIRIEYNPGNRKPNVQMTANKLGGSAPLNLKLSAKGTTDTDGDPLTYSWQITSRTGGSRRSAGYVGGGKTGFVKVAKTSDVSLTLAKKGLYKATLTVNDGKGGISSQSMDITVGNEAPLLTVNMPSGNNSFYIPNKPFHYTVNVTDKEDGILGKGIDPERVAVTINYLSEGYDKVAVAQGHRSADVGALLSAGGKLTEASDCKACHSLNKKSIGPSYLEVASKYKDDKTALERLTKKVIAGGSGVWGETAMAAHPQLSTADAAQMVNYILSVSSEAATKTTLPVKGTYVANLPAGDKGKGVYILRAAYVDKGADGLPTQKVEQTLVLRNTSVDTHGFDDYKDVRKVAGGGANLLIASKSGSYIVLRQIDLHAISELRLRAMAPKAQINTIGGKVELRLDSPTGKLIGESQILEAGASLTQLHVPVQLPDRSDQAPHDAYVVFVNPKPEQGSLMIVMSTEFILNDPKPE